MTSGSYSERYPALFSEMYWEWGPITAQFRLADTPPPLARVSHARIVPFVDDQVVVLKMGEGQWDHPGGTLEPDEHWRDAMGRELMEEAGARIHDFKIFGSLDCTSLNPKPYRPHLPYPEFSQVVVYANVEIVSEPVAPSDGDFEVIEQVEVVDLEVAVERLKKRRDGHWQAEMYQLAAELRSASRDSQDR